MNLYDISYTIALIATAPIWGFRGQSRRKVLKALTQRMGHVPPLATRNSPLATPVVLIHAVSLGEMNATRAMVAQLLARRPELRVIVSTTTDSGYDRGRQIYPPTGPVRLVRFPVDFSSAIRRFLDRLRPSVVVLMELELWPNFLLHCHRRNIPVVLVNGRITPTAYRRYRRVKPVTARMFRRLIAICAQEPAYADRFIELGAPADRVQVSGTMKFDTAEIASRVPGDDVLAVQVRIDCANGPVWVCGSTGPGEEPLLIAVYLRLIESCPTLRMVIVPRKPERFDEVAQIITNAGFALFRRSGKPGSPSSKNLPTIILGDTMGELRTFYSLATVVFVGRTLVDLGARQHGSDMIEPAALAKPVAVGPFTHNFAEPMRLLLASNGIVQIDSDIALAQTITDWLQNPEDAKMIGQRAQQVVHDNQGTTDRHVETILGILNKTLLGAEPIEP